MFFLHKLIKAGITVVYESRVREMIWVFKENGSEFFTGTANEISCPDLRSRETVHIFDCRAGPETRQPVSSAAKLILFSSTNINSYKQTIRDQPLDPFVIPSTTEEEFFMYASRLGISHDRAAEVAKIFGTGKIRPLVRKSLSVDGAIQAYSLDKLKIYASVENTVSGESSPAILIDVDLPPPIESESSSAEHNLAIRYEFSNALWRYSSADIVKKLSQLHEDEVERVLQGVLAGLNSSYAVFNRTFGTMHGMLLEHYAPKFVVKYGITCTQVSDPTKSFSIPKGSLTVVQCERKPIEDVLRDCKDPKKLYFFGDNNPGFDFFVPPNKFFNTTSTLTNSGSHDISLRTAMEICQQLKDDEAKFVFVVPEREQEKWAREQSFIIKDQAVLAKLNKDGDSSIKLGGVRSFKKLPLGTQQLLGTFRQYLAPLKISRSFSTAASRGVATLRKIWRPI
jgi:hypothetical protein